MPAWTRRFILGVVATAACTAGGLTAAGPALADLSPACPQAPISQPFSAFGDTHDYSLVPGGDFSSGAPGWTLTGGATIVSDPGAPSGYAVNMPAGSTVTTPAFCTTNSDPVMRAFGYTVAVPAPAKVHGKSSQDDATLAITAMLADSSFAVPVGDVPNLSSWGPTRTMALAPVSTAFPIPAVWAQYRFAAIDGATWRLDDVFVDPRMRR